jgi:hypothetical protein
VATKDVPEIGREIWHHDNPRGPAGRFRGGSKMLLGIWDFSKNPSAAKDLLLHLSQKEQVHRLVKAGKGYDIPLVAALPPIVVYAFLMDFYVSGLTGGATKG